MGYGRCLRTHWDNQHVQLAKVDSGLLDRRLQKYRRNSPATMNGCLLLIYYWFLEKKKAKNWILGKQTETPRFLRWSIKEIFNLELLFKNENLVVDLIKAGPWTC